MGIVALASLAFPILLGGMLFGACVTSVRRNGEMLLYRIVAVGSVVFGLYLAYPAPTRSGGGGEYIGLQRLIEVSFSWLNMGLFVVGLGVALAAAYGKESLDRVMSGMSWGLATAFVVRFILVVFG